jgi:hypothetical protein
METDSEKLEQSIENADRIIAKEESKPISKEKLAGAVRTYATDIAEMMRKEKGSIIKIALAEQTRREKFQKKKDPTSTKNVIVVMLGFILIVGGIMVFIYAIINQNKPVSVVNTNNGILPSLFFTENQVQIDMSNLNKSELFNAIQLQVENKTLVLKTINNLFISYNTTSGQTQVPSTVFVQKLNLNVPDNLFQNLYSQFMLGIYAKEPKNNLFVVFKIKDFNDSFIAMRDWEGTMLSDLVRLFRIDTSSAGKNIFNKNFETVTLGNKEARVIKDSEGNVMLAYIFLNSKTIMITSDTDSVEEVVKRLNLQTLK